MHAKARSHFQVALIASAVSFLAGCASVGDASRNMVSAITPYKVEVVQGNFVSSEQVAALQPGMSRQQVREILGTPLVTSVFHADRWEYVFTIRRKGVEAQSRKLTVFFDGDRLSRAEGDSMPSEAEFVASLGTPLTKVKVPELQATDAQLSKFPASKAPVEELVEQRVAPGSRNYPPLESGR